MYVCMYVWIVRVIADGKWYSFADVGTMLRNQHRSIQGSLVMSSRLGSCCLLAEMALLLSVNTLGFRTHFALLAVEIGKGWLVLTDFILFARVCVRRLVARVAPATGHRARRRIKAAIKGGTTGAHFSVILNLGWLCNAGLPITLALIVAGIFAGK